MNKSPRYAVTSAERTTYSSGFDATRVALNGLSVVGFTIGEGQQVDQDELQRFEFETNHPGPIGMVVLDHDAEEVAVLLEQTARVIRSFAEASPR